MPPVVFEEDITPACKFNEKEYRELKSRYEQMLRQLRIFLRDLLSNFLIRKDNSLICYQFAYAISYIYLLYHHYDIKCRSEESEVCNMVYITRNFYCIHLLIVISYHKIFHSRHITPPGRNLSFSEMMSHIVYNRCISIRDIIVTDIFIYFIIRQVGT